MTVLRAKDTLAVDMGFVAPVVSLCSRTVETDIPSLRHTNLV